MPILLLGLGLALLVFLWAREWFGFAGGILSLALFCFDPNFVAHSGLVTTDVGEALFMFGAIYFLWRICRRVEAASVGLFLLFFALAFVTKFSAVLLLPIFWLVALGRMLFPDPLFDGATGKDEAGLFDFQTDFFHGPVCRRPADNLRCDLGVLFLPIFRRPKTGKGGEGRGANPEGEPVGTVESRIPYRELGYFPIEAAVRGSAATERLLATAPLGQVRDEDVLKIMDKVPLGLDGKLILFAQKYRLLPEAYIFGFAHAEMKSYMRGIIPARQLFQHRIPELFFLRLPAQNTVSSPVAHHHRAGLQSAAVCPKAAGRCSFWWCRPACIFWRPQCRISISASAICCPFIRSFMFWPAVWCWS